MDWAEVGQLLSLGGNGIQLHPDHMNSDGKGSGFPKETPNTATRGREMSTGQAK